MPAITRSEGARVVVVALVIVALTSLPYVLGFARSDAEHVYSGATLDLVDYNSYLAKMQQGARGSWRFSITYTSEEHAGAWVYLFYLLLGHVARWTGWSVLGVYHVARVLSALAMLLAMYTLIAALIFARALRWLAFVLAGAGSGLGWLQLLVAPTPPGGISPIDFWLIDGFPFFSALTFPHFTAAIALMALTLVGLLAMLTQPTWRAATLTAACSFGLTVIHPFGGGLVILIGIFYAVLLVWARQVSWPRAVASAISVMLLALPVLGYDVWLFSTQPAFRAWSLQNVTPSPPPGYYLVSYGVLLVLALAGLARVARRREWRALLAATWLVVAIPLLYIPTNLQRRFLEGLMIPLCVLASVGAVVLLRRWPGVRRWRRRALILLVALMLPSNLALVAGTSLASFSRSPSVFYSADVVSAVDWLDAHAGPNDIVLASFPVGNLIPARTGQRVVLGHWIETPDYARRAEQVRAFFDVATSEDVRRAFLSSEHASYVFWGPDERALGTFDPSRSIYLVEVFRSQDVVVYRVRSP